MTIEIREVTYSDGSKGEVVVIPNGKGFTTMPKSVYDEMLAKQNEVAPK